MDLLSLLGNASLFLGFASNLALIASASLFMLHKHPKKQFDDQSSFSALILFSLFASTAAAATMIIAFFRHDFSILFVYENNSIHTPRLYTITGMWSSLAGSILLWSLFQNVYLSIHYFSKKGKLAVSLLIRELLILGSINLFFFVLLVFFANPFNLNPLKHVIDGLGPSPLLQNNFLVSIHPIFIYLGLVGISLPSSLALAQLWDGRKYPAAEQDLRKLLLVPLAFLSLGIVMGALWSYEVLGWGGFWAWDPVENAALLPWIFGVAALHSIVASEKRGVHKITSKLLIVSSFFLTIFATFLTRSGIVESVHSFTESSIGPLFTIFLALLLIFTIYVFSKAPGHMRSKVAVNFGFNRTTMLTLNNFVLVSIGLAIFFGTIYPVIASVFGQSLSVGANYFNAFFAPLGVIAVALMAIGPALGYSKSKSSFQLISATGLGAALIVFLLAIIGLKGPFQIVAYFFLSWAFLVATFETLSQFRTRNHLQLNDLVSKRLQISRLRSVIGMVAHIGIIVIFLGVLTTLSYSHKSDLSLRPGQTSSFEGHKIKYVSYIVRNGPSAQTYWVTVSTDGKLYYPHLTVFSSSGQGVASPAIAYTPFFNLYIEINALPSSPNGEVHLAIIYQPLINLIWTGGLILFLSLLIGIFLGLKKGKLKSNELPVFSDDSELDLESEKALEVLTK